MELDARIEKWEAEIENILEKQKEYNQKSSEKVRELRKKIQETERQIKLENNQMIADLVRELFGEVNENTVEEFKRIMEQARPRNNTPALSQERE